MRCRLHLSFAASDRLVDDVDGVEEGAAAADEDAEEEEKEVLKEDREEGEGGSLHPLFQKV